MKSWVDLGLKVFGGMMAGVVAGLLLFQGTLAALRLMMEGGSLVVLSFVTLAVVGGSASLVWITQRRGTTAEDVSDEWEDQ